MTPTFAEATGVWLRVAAQSFGGPAAQIAVMHRLVVEERRWVDEETFLHALSFCTLLPGPEAMQLATYLGWKLHGLRGALVAGCLFVLPGFLALAALSALYVVAKDALVVVAVLWGVKAAIVAVVLEAVQRVAKRALKHRAAWVIAAAVFLATTTLALPYPLVVLAAGLAGAIWLVPAASSQPVGPRPAIGSTALSLGVGLVLWWVPVGIAALALGPDHAIVGIGTFFSEVAVVTIGGAYSVLDFVATHAVVDKGWLSHAEMLDGLGMAETTPGPLIQVVQFVAFLGAFRAPGPLSPWTSAWLGSVMVTWVTYVPSFTWVLAGAPWVERLRTQPRLAGALAGVTAAVVGVILHLATYVATHTLFAETWEAAWGGGRVLVPVPSSVQWAAVVVAVASGVALLGFRVKMLPVLGVAALAGLLWRFALGM